MKIETIHFVTPTEDEIEVVGPEGQTTRLPWPVLDGRARHIERWLARGGSIAPYVAPPAPPPEPIFRHADWPDIPMRLTREALAAYGQIGVAATLREPTDPIFVEDADGKVHTLLVSQAKLLLRSYSQAAERAEYERRQREAGAAWVEPASVEGP